MLCIEPLHIPRDQLPESCESWRTKKGHGSFKKSGKAVEMLRSSCLYQGRWRILKFVSASALTGKFVIQIVDIIQDANMLS